LGSIRGRETIRNAAGQGLVELAILLPFLLLLMVGVADVGRMFYLSIELTGAARAGVQYGAQNPVTAIDGPGMVLRAQQEAADVVGTWWGTATNFTATTSLFCQCQDGSVVACTSLGCSGPQFTFVRVDTSADFHPLTAFLGMPASITFRGRAIMRVSNG
jgi:Flp pilus assembly protein TadG